MPLAIPLRAIFNTLTRVFAFMPFGMISPPRANDTMFGITKFHNYLHGQEHA
jgi:hypothetical protein